MVDEAIAKVAYQVQYLTSEGTWRDVLSSKARVYSIDDARFYMEQEEDKAFRRDRKAPPHRIVMEITTRVVVD